MKDDHALCVYSPKRMLCMRDAPLSEENTHRQFYSVIPFLFNNVRLEVYLVEQSDKNSIILFMGQSLGDPSVSVLAFYGVFV